MPEKGENNLKKEIDDVKVRLDEICFSMYKKDFKKAESQMEELIRKSEGKLKCDNDEIMEYYNFESCFELFLYDQLFSSGIQRVCVTYPYAEIYRLYGKLLLEMERPNEAVEVLKGAIRWNPVSVKTHFEYAESLRQLKRMDEYLEITKKIFQLAYTRVDLARTYRNMGYYFLVKEDYKAAIGCYIWSFLYEKDSKEAQAQLCYIKIIADRDVRQPNIGDFEQIAKKEGFPIVLNEEILEIAIGYGNYFAEKGNISLAKEMYSIAYDLTHEKEFQELIDSLDRANANN